MEQQEYGCNRGNMKLVKLKSRKVGSFPVLLRLPKWFLKVNKIKSGDVLDIYITDTGELIIKKRG